MNERMAQETLPDDVRIPDGKSLGEWVESRVARFSSRTLDWNALKFQADYDPKYRRTQMRYIGTGATGVAADSNTVPAENFTFSTMVLRLRGSASPAHGRGGSILRHARRTPPAHGRTQGPALRDDSR